jgi:hypothetical protein
MANSKISQLPSSIAVKDTDLLAIVQEDNSVLSTNKITVADFKSGINLSVGNVAGAESGTEIVNGKVYLGGMPLLRNTTVNQNSFFFKLENGAFLSTGTTGESPVLGAGRRLMWIPYTGAFRAGEVTNDQWDNANLGKYSAAFGWNTKANGTASFALGVSTQASNDQATAIGFNTKAFGPNSFAMGDKTEATGNNAISGGINTKANGNSSVAFGDNTIASNYAGIAVGKDTRSYGQMSSAFGVNSEASNTASFVTGLNSYARGVGAFAAGADNEANASLSIAMGGGSKAYGDCSMAVGNEAIAQGNVSVSMGEGTLSIGTCSLAVGWESQSRKPQSVAFGTRTIADGDNALVFGNQSKANGQNSFAGGFSAVADGGSSFAFGSSAWAKGFGSVALGNSSVAEGNQSVALGFQNTATGNSALVAGSMSEATNEESIAIGCGVKSYGRQSVSLGCHAESGTPDGLSGMAAIAIGDHAQAIFDHSLAVGSFVQANAEAAFVIGKGLSNDFLTNTTEQSLVVGFGSALPTLFVGPSPSSSTSGNVGIGTVLPLAKFHIDGDLRLENGTAVNRISVDGTLSGNSDLTLPTEKAIKTYVDSLASSVRRNKGAIDCSANPNYPAGINGDTYQVSVAGKIGGVNGKVVDVNDEIVCKDDNGGGDEATVGSQWYVLEGNKGQATETTKGIAKIASQVDTNAGINDTDIVTPLKLNIWLTSKSTSNITEGSNLYFTPARVLSTQLTSLNPALSGAITASDTHLSALSKTANHIADTNNPHNVTKSQIGLSNVDNVQQLPLSYLDTDIALTANSDAKVPSQKAIKSYVDSRTTVTKLRKILDFSLVPIANSTTGLFTKSADSATEALPTTSPYNSGINNGGVDPYVIGFDSTVKSIRLTLGKAAVSTGTASSGTTIRIDLYKVLSTSRTLLASMDVPVDHTKVSINNDMGQDNFQTAVLSGLSIPLSSGDLIGIQFTNRGGSNTTINAAGRVFAALEIQEN